MKNGQVVKIYKPKASGGRSILTFDHFGVFQTWGISPDDGTQAVVMKNDGFCEMVSPSLVKISSFETQADEEFGIDIAELRTKKILLNAAIISEAPKNVPMISGLAVLVNAECVELKRMKNFVGAIQDDALHYTYYFEPVKLKSKLYEI